jgi:hypothetical protein
MYVGGAIWNVRQPSLVEVLGSSDPSSLVTKEADMPTPSRTEETFELLRSTVEDLHSTGRRIYAAGLKPELKRRSYGGFDEKAIDGGFMSFKRFLEAAQSRGIVDLTPAPVGPDVLVTPHGMEPAEFKTADTEAPSGAPAPVGAGRFIRREFWRAFIDWRDDDVRIYDPASDTVLRFPSEPVPLEPHGQAERRRRWAEEPERFHRITPIGIERQLEWMRAFASTAEEPMKTALVLALANEKPFQAFSVAVRADHGTGARWQAERARLVASEIAEWARDAGIDPRIFEPPLRAAKGEPSSVKSMPGSSHEAEVRRKVHVAIERMPLSALYALSIPVEYLVDL